MKNKKYIEDSVVIINVERRYSKKNAESYYLIEAVTGWPCEYVRTYVSEHLENFSEWRKVITSWTGTEAIAVRGDFRVKRNDPSLINADCLVEILARTPLSDFLQQVRESWD